MVKIIGISGTFASGKDTLADELANKHGFLHVSTGDIVREETKTLYNSTERPVLVEHANKMRAERGPGVLVLVALERYEAVKDQYPGGVVISGIRSIGEVEELKAAGGTMVFVDAPVGVRYQRQYGRNRDPSDEITFEEFQTQEELEMTKPLDNRVDQNIGGVKSLADLVLDNGGGLDDFLNDALAKLGIA